jgi:hypothetical protein
MGERGQCLVASRHYFIRKINPKVPLWLYCIGVACYPFVWFFLTTRMRYFSPEEVGSWFFAQRTIQSALDSYPRSTALLPFELPFAITAALVWPFLCFTPLMIFSSLREQNWRFPLKLGLAFSVASAVSGIARAVFSWAVLGLRGRHDFGRDGFDALTSRDYEVLLFWFVPTALGAMTSYRLLASNPDHHHPPIQPP